MADVILFAIAVFTSAIAGVIGLGGGMLLIALLPFFLPASAIIPVHGVTQLLSNSSRVYFAMNAVEWPLVPKFLLGSLVGLVLFGVFLLSLPVKYLPLFIGFYILLNLWSKPFKRIMMKYQSFYIAGFIQSGLGLIVGATGPLTLTLVKNELSDKNQIVATTALFMAISHLGKIVVFGLMGFAFWEYASELVALILGAVLGSFVGTKMRHKIDGNRFVMLLNIALTILAARMIAVVLM